MTRLATLGVMAAVAVAVPMAAQKGSEPSLDVLLTRAAGYLANYEKAFSSVVSEERYLQTGRDMRMDMSPGRFVGAPAGSRRELKSDVIAAAGTGHAWVTFRDVYAVDGHAVRDRDERLQKLFLDPKGNPMNAARVIADEGARFNLGTVSRNVNSPTMPLTFLATDNQSRSKFRRSGTGKVAGVETVVIEFEETGRPTIVKSGTDDLPVSGRFWVEPASGRVMKAAVQFDARDFSGEISVTFGYVEKLKMWVPLEMADSVKSPRETVTGRATYSNFRRFGVSTEVVIK